MPYIYIYTKRERLSAYIYLTTLIYHINSCLICLFRLVAFLQVTLNFDWLID